MGPMGIPVLCTRLIWSPATWATCSPWLHSVHKCPSPRIHSDSMEHCVGLVFAWITADSYAYATLSTVEDVFDFCGMQFALCPAGSVNTSILLRHSISPHTRGVKRYRAMSLRAGVYSRGTLNELKTKIHNRENADHRIVFVQLTTVIW